MALEHEGVTLAQATEQLRAKVAGGADVGATIKFAFEDGSVIYIDGGANPGTVDNESRDAECVISVDFADFVDIGRGDLDATTAFMTGKLKVEGDIALAMKLSSIM